MESVHPALVHFPIALLAAALLVDGLALLLRRSAWHRIALWNLALGTLGAAAAVLSGLQAETTAKHSFEIHQVLQLHKTLGLSTLGLAVVVTAWRLWRRDQLSAGGRWAATACLALAVGTALYGAFLGGRLVYEFGVGGMFGATRSQSEHSEHRH